MIDCVSYMYIYNSESVTKSYDPTRQKIVQKFLEQIENELQEDVAVRNAFYVYCLMSLDNDVRAIYRNNGKKSISLRESINASRESFDMPVFNRAKQKVKLRMIKPGKIYIRCLLVKSNIPILLALNI